MPEPPEVKPRYQGSLGHFVRGEIYSVGVIELIYDLVVVTLSEPKGVLLFDTFGEMMTCLHPLREACQPCWQPFPTLAGATDCAIL